MNKFKKILLISIYFNFVFIKSASTMSDVSRIYRRNLAIITQHNLNPDPDLIAQRQTDHSPRPAWQEDFRHNSKKARNKRKNVLSSLNENALSTDDQIKKMPKTPENSLASDLVNVTLDSSNLPGTPIELNIATAVITHPKDSSSSTSSSDKYRSESSDERDLKYSIDIGYKINKKIYIKTNIILGKSRIKADVFILRLEAINTSVTESNKLHYVFIFAIPEKNLFFGLRRHGNNIAILDKVKTLKHHRLSELSSDELFVLDKSFDTILVKIIENQTRVEKIKKEQEELKAAKKREKYNIASDNLSQIKQEINFNIIELLTSVEKQEYSKEFEDNLKEPFISAVELYSNLFDLPSKELKQRSENQHNLIKYDIIIPEIFMLVESINDKLNYEFIYYNKFIEKYFGIKRENDIITIMKEEDSKIKYAKFYSDTPSSILGDYDISEHIGNINTLTKKVKENYTNSLAIYSGLNKKDPLWPQIHKSEKDRYEAEIQKIYPKIYSEILEHVINSIEFYLLHYIKYFKPMLKRVRKDPGLYIKYLYNQQHPKKIENNSCCVIQ